ncbi:HisA/HisF-related TIM barrel protein [Vulcanisaeta thermophila]|uniref:HisA/HisF-related TIM barrel protein n=1 Tax=Vulcanisaeta thermophila TaxID=867917 RepID=UPI000852CD06|nr:HisA/HisF-related TIM barrel protein [Vulcanisaeta thermophila]
MGRLLIPSVDLSGGYVVKRVRGLRGTEQVRLGIDEAVKLVKGYPRIHIVDLDGAEVGRPVNVDAIRKVALEVNGKCQMGGGIRDVGVGKEMLNHCDRVVLGSVAVEEPGRLMEFLRVLGREHVVVSLDVSGGYVMSRGWTRRVAPLPEVIRALPRVGAVVFTDIDVEGTGMGVRVGGGIVEELRSIADEVYYAGGVGGCDDVAKLWSLGFDGVIIGYAFYVKGVRCND